MVHSIEMQFDDKMDWGNYGKYWDIDHVIPQRMFDFSKENHVRACWSLSNIRPLRIEENEAKACDLDLELIEKYNLKFVFQKLILGDLE